MHRITEVTVFSPITPHSSARKKPQSPISLFALEMILGFVELEGEKRMVKLIFVLKTHDCWKNAVETSSAVACGTGQEGGGSV